VKPYYADEAVTIYHGDARELWWTESLTFDAVISDPPYGIRYSPGGGGKGWAPKTFTGKDIVAGDAEPFDPEFLLGDWPVVLFGGNHFAPRLPASSEWIVWDKRDGPVRNNFGDAELIWTNGKGPVRLVAHLWNGAFRASERDEQRVHPTQKPVFLMRWLVERYSQPGQTILDPFMGSGTTLVAAKSCNRKAIGIEIEERYCEIAARRCSQEVLGLSA
jgi:site-specific DNA-methyltransferase (adenine-specific)